MKTHPQEPEGEPSSCDDPSNTNAPINARQPLKIVWGWGGVKTDLKNRILNKKSYLSDWADGFHWRVLAGMDNRRLFLHIAAL